MKLIKARIAGIHLDNAENQRIVIQTLGGSRIIAADSLIEFLQLHKMTSLSVQGFSGKHVKSAVYLFGLYPDTWPDPPDEPRPSG